MTVAGHGTTAYVLDYAAGNQVLAETLLTGTTHYLYAHECLGEVREGEPLYYLHDGEGLVRQGADASGEIVSRWRFDPDGTVLEGPEGPVSHLICGGVYDWSTGLIHRNGGYFDPLLGIWLALAPLSVIQIWRRRRKKGGHPWVMMVGVALLSMGTLAGCAGNGSEMSSTPTPVSLCTELYGRIGLDGLPDYGYDYNPEDMFYEGQCTECAEIVTRLQSEPHTIGGGFTYIAKRNGSPDWIPSNPPYYGAQAKIQIVTTRPDVSFFDIARNCIVIQIVKGYRALRRVGSSEWEYDSVFNNPNSYMVDGPEGSTNPNWLSYEDNVDIDDRIFVRDTPAHPIESGETVLWEEEFVTLVYDKSVLRRLTLRPFVDFVGSVNELNGILGQQPVAEFIWHLNNGPNGWMRP